LTAARAAAIARYYRDQTSLPFLNVLVLGRGNSEPISTSKDLRNRRVEITVTPAPVAFQPPEPNQDNAGAGSGTASAATSGAVDAPKPAGRKKAKAANKDVSSVH
jgi:hypothetical protein